MKHWGIRARVMLVAVLPVLALAIVLTVFYTSTRVADHFETTTARGQAFARQLAAASEYAVFSGNTEAVRQLAASVLLEHDVVGVRVIDRNGETLVANGEFDHSLSSFTEPLANARVLQSEHTLRVIEPILASRLELDDGLSAVALSIGSPASLPLLGNVTLDISLTHLNEQRNALLSTGVGLALFMLLVSTALAAYMSRGVTGPIRQVARAVGRIGEGRFAERLPNIGGGSLRKLAQGVNEMAAQLAHANDDLNRQIADATAELRMRKEEAERATLAKSRFLAAASHDLRQPMHALGLFVAELAQHQHSAAAEKLVQRVAASAEAMEDLLDSLLDISKLDAGVLHPSVRAFPLMPAIERVMAVQRARAEARKIELKARATPFWITSDPILFERILGNLVSNAVRYTNDGRVLIACRQRGDRLRIEVRDSGVGIDADSQEIIFQEFVQLDNPERSRDKGLGLGLAIVHRLTELLGHGLSLRSRPGLGSVFAIEVPIASPVEDAATDDGARQPGDLAGTRVVLIDDDALAREATGSLLSSWKCEVTAASDLTELLAALKNCEPPHIIISDFRLQGPNNGLATIHALRKRFGADLPAALISGDTGADTLRLARNAGLPLLHKPVRPARLRALLNRLSDAG